MQFTSRNAAKITAKVTGSTEKVSFDGTTTANVTPESAKTQIDKIMHVVNKTVNTSGMTRTIIQEATA